MATYAIQLRAEALRSLAADDIDTTYVAVGTPLANPCRIFKIDNQTNALLIGSFNSRTDHFVLPTGSFILIDVTTNEILSEGFYISKGSEIGVRYDSDAPTTGAVYVSAFYSGS